MCCPRNEEMNSHQVDQGNYFPDRFIMFRVIRSIEAINTPTINRMRNVPVPTQLRFDGKFIYEIRNHQFRFHK